MSNPIDDYLKHLSGVLAIGGAFASIPLLASFAALQPPWPPALGYVSAALILLAALIVWEWTRKSRVKRRRRWIGVGTCLCIFGLIAYLPLYSTFVEERPGGDLRFVRGYVCTANALKIYGEECPDLPRSALADAEWESVRLWTRRSVTVARLSLVAAWLLFICGLILAVGGIVGGRQHGRGEPETAG